MKSAPESRSLLATVSEQLIALEKRDWELWMVSAGAGICLCIGVLVLLFRAAFLEHGLFRLNIVISPELFFGLVALLILFNTYLINRRLELRRTREQVISTTIQSELMRLQSFTDPLTEVYNRRALDNLARRFISHAKRLGKPLTFMMVDVDRFRDINTRFGHLMGDFVIAEVATMLRGAVRGTDAVVRYGGDEFLVILADTNSRGGQVVMDRISRLLAEWNGAKHLKDFELTLSIGLAEWSEDKAVDQLLDEADQAMYSTKERNKKTLDGKTQPPLIKSSSQSAPVVKI
ncbi:MAG TPA: GGDEF domain-containing protein [Terriglobia bacterium]|jgi:diguanylate cyclase (GGDEF)-like protein|nr:GGDEF domain-containing protein [Terriglobia bacterium]